ncbi:MAG: hypothetical protein KDA24_23315, partial [Deltaproteobacteria bacterium]|nr:hypothetical protein [Deltaproteobacteria bacterium]
QVEVLFADLAAHATIGEIILKGAPTARADASTQSTLQEGFDALRLGRARGVQVRYMHNGREWWDTLMRTPDGIRLVRIER